MKRLLGLLLVMGMVGCGGGDTSPKSSQAKSDEPPVQTVDLSRTVERGGLRYEVNSETPFTGVAVDKYENGQKKHEVTWKDGKKLSGTYWDEEGNEVEIDEWNRF